MILPAIVALVAGNYAAPERPRAYGLVMGAGAIAVAVGPLIGGVATTYFSWRWVFVGEVLVDQRRQVSARAGLLLGAHASGSSYQPNLLSRSSRDQAIIVGVAASSAFGWGTVSNSILRSVADRLPGATGSTRAQVATGMAVDERPSQRCSAGSAASRLDGRCCG